MKTIQTDTAPKAIGPYSQAVVINNLLFCSGQIAIDPKTNSLVEGNIETQTIQVLHNLQNILKAASYNLSDVAKTTIYITDITKFQIVNDLYTAFFGTHKPARSTVEVSNLPKSALIEIELVAAKKQ